jgi:hypothetical protein
VRSKPERRIGTINWDALFPPELVPISQHPRLAETGPAPGRQAIARHLLRYLDFTAKLEHLVVNRTALGIAQGLTGFSFSKDMRLDAYRIYCDEAYHALFSATLASEVADLTGLSHDETSTPYFLSRLQEILAGCGEELAPLLEILFVICSETLISNTLAEVGNSPEVDETVREVVRDHAHDESRHHAYFAAVLRHIWPQLTDDARREAGRIVPDLITAFLAPDLADLRRELSCYGLGEDEISEVLADSYPADRVSEDIGEMARYTVQHFAVVGALDEPETTENFARAGLLSPERA